MQRVKIVRANNEAQQNRIGIDADTIGWTQVNLVHELRQHNQLDGAKTRISATLKRSDFGEARRRKRVVTG